MHYMRRRMIAHGAFPDFVINRQERFITGFDFTRKLTNMHMKITGLF